MLNLKKPRLWAMILSIILVISVGIGLLLNSKLGNSRNIGIIGGADGPTSIFLSSKDGVATESDFESQASTIEKISLYVKEECKNVFSPYYELLDFEISDYHEETVGEQIESIFSYTVKYKNYDKDPDTVGYIKEAKERGDSNYQIFYDEYLQIKEMNFYFKTVLNKDYSITLFTKNPAIESDWEEVKFSDFILK